MAARHFGISDNTVRSWVKRTREQEGIAPAPRNGATGALHILPQPPSPAPSPVVITPPAEKPALPASMRGKARRAVSAMLDRMIVVAPRADAKETAAMFAALTDRFDILGTIKPERRKSAGEPGSPEWLEEQVELAAALPPEVLESAVKRQKGA